MKKEAILKINYLLKENKYIVSFRLYIGYYKNKLFILLDELHYFINDYEKPSALEVIVKTLNNDLIIKKYQAIKIRILINSNCFYHLIVSFPKLSIDEVNNNLIEKYIKKISDNQMAYEIVKRLLMVNNKQYIWSVNLIPVSLIKLINDFNKLVYQVTNINIKEVDYDIDYFQKLIFTYEKLNEEQYYLLTINDDCYSLYEINKKIIQKVIVKSFINKDYHQSLDELVFFLERYHTKITYIDIQNPFYEQTFFYLRNHLSTHQLYLLNERPLTSGGFYGL